MTDSLEAPSTFLGPQR